MTVNSAGVALKAGNALRELAVRGFMNEGGNAYSAASINSMLR
jgi:hypothetical protein